MRRKWQLLVSLLVIAALLIAVPAAANGELVFDYWGWDAGCGYPYVDAGAYLGYSWEEPAIGEEVTFTMEGQEPVVTYTDEGGYAWASFPFELGSEPTLIGIDAGEWGYGEVWVSGPDPETCEAIQPFVEVSWPCGQAPSVTLGWTGEIYGVSASIWTEGDERWDWTEEGDSITFEELIPGATYYYFLGWWTEDWENWGWTNGEFTVPEECTAPPLTLVIPDLYAYVNPGYVAPEGVAGVSPYDVCFILSDNGEPSVERRTANCDYLWPSGPRPGWTEGAYLLVHGPVYYDGTDWGYWTGDFAVSQFTYTGAVPRLPLYGSPGLFTVWCEYKLESTGELPGWCLP